MRTRVRSLSNLLALETLPLHPTGPAPPPPPYPPPPRAPPPPRRRPPPPAPPRAAARRAAPPSHAPAARPRPPRRRRRRRKVGARGFVANATTATAHYFGQAEGRGTMPHALIGYAGSTLRAAEMFRETFPDDEMTVLVDYFGREVSDSLAVCRRFPDL